MQQQYYCRVRDQVIKIFAVRKHLIRWNKDKKNITMLEVEMLEHKFSVVFSDLASSKFIVENFDTLVYFVQPNNGVFLNNLNDLLYHANEIINNDKK
jgi:hypothetical protein